jgi:ribosomal protein S18 acetylase RimI-like enzyme
VLHYRTFRNTDPPRLVELWNQIFVGTGAVQLAGTSLLEFHVLAKPYFDPAGLLLAFDDDIPVGFAHAGFGTNIEEKALSVQTGVICLLGVIPVYRRSGIGTELLHRSEAYLRAKGAQELYAGSSPRRNPFYLGLYGGSNSAGVLASDTAAGPFLLHHGYRPVESFELWERRLDVSFAINDWRFPGHRRKYELRIAPRSGTSTWWRECIEGPLELVEFRLEEKPSGKLMALATAWDMETYSQRWREAAVGIVQVEVEPSIRRQGLAKFLLDQILRHLQDQCFVRAELITSPDDELASNLFRGLGFQQIDVGHSYKRMRDEL